MAEHPAPSNQQLFITVLAVTITETRLEGVTTLPLSSGADRVIEGQVDIKVLGVWGGICNHGWTTNNEATVICK